jgi:hypothetical protein
MASSLQVQILSLKFSLGKFQLSRVSISLRALGCCCLWLPYECDMSYLRLQRLRYERARPVILNGKKQQTINNK